MAIYRLQRVFNQKNFSIFDNIKNMTKIYLKDLSKKYKHIKGVVSSFIHRIKTAHINNALGSKFFSESEFNSCDRIPDYKKLLLLKNLETDRYKDFVSKSDWLSFFPSFQFVIDPNTIEKYAEDYNYKWTEVMFNYYSFENKNFETVLIYDFEKNSWYVKDTTYEPPKEFLIKGTLKDYLLVSFDYKFDELLKNRINSLNKESHRQFVIDYLDWHRFKINEIFK